MILLVWGPGLGNFPGVSLTGEEGEAVLSPGRGALFRGGGRVYSLSRRATPSDLGACCALEPRGGAVQKCRVQGYCARRGVPGMKKRGEKSREEGEKVRSGKRPDSREQGQKGKWSKE